MAHSFDRYLLKLFKKCVLFLLLWVGNFVTAQLSDLHYLPPLKQGQNNAGIKDQAIYLSTPEPTTFTVNAYRGTNPTPVATFNISNVSPAVWTLGDGDNNITLVNNGNTGVVLTNSGLRFESPSGNRFYVNYRGNSSAQAASLTAKGRQALGTRFKWGGVPNLGAHPSKSNTLGIMATEDNTTIHVFGYDPDCEFRVGNDRAGITDNTYTITLDANESFVFETYIGNSPTQAHEDGWIGASIVSDKDIVISNGSINFGRQVGASNRDAGIDQPVPENRLGKEYVFIRGNGNTNGWTEFPLLIATADNTQIFVNGSTTPIATIDNGEYFQVPSNNYSSNSVGANMLVQTSKDVYAYQCMAGASKVYTQGLNFVAPVNCLLPDVMDNIPDIRNMAGLNVTGGVTIIAAVNTPDANIQVTDGNGPVTLPASNPVAGSTDWKTFFIPNLNGDVSVQSTGPMAIGFFGYNGARGVAGYFSGFDTLPEVTLAIRGGSGCFVGSEIYEATNNNFDAFQWYENGQPIPGANSPSYSPPGAGEYFLRGTKGPCTYDSNPLQALYCDPDVALEKTVDKTEIMEGETTTFTIRVQNWGLGPLTNLQITDNIPTGLTLVNAFTISGSWSGNTWNIGTLNGGEVAELELEVRADEINLLPLLSLTNTATNTQDQTDTNITPDHPTAILTVHNDFDNDGVNDITDLDDDNDGIYDEEECDTLLFNISDGNTHNGGLMTVDKYLVLDVFSIDNSFNLQINGNDVAGEIQFQDGASGNVAKFTDGTGYGENGNPDVWTITGTYGSPLLRVVVDQVGQLTLFGTRSSNGPLEPMTLTTPANTVNWNASGNNTISIGQAIAGPTNMRGVLLTAGCDTDSDGLPDPLDLDSDGDGCSDANEYYKDNNADGADGGEYGSGVPVVDPMDGSVNGASYTKVFAPEIFLGNTSENMGGQDINGEGVNLGQTFQYVLRFQNTGDDSATNYVIRDILPNNVSLDNIDVSNAPGTTNTYDINTNTIEFQVPDNLMEVGDPEYSIRISVTVSADCSDFVDACSSQLENLAYATFQGVLNPNVFTDELGNSNFPCNHIPEVASNNILDDLANCGQARTVQLCGDDVLLAAGSGFSTYTWALDTNGNGQIDGSDTVLNDGDPDNDPSTLLVTDIGNYIVEKSASGSCPDLSELITVERFGTTQTNPIIAYFNQVNSDSDLDNDLNGEIVACSLDGDLLPKIFLCGENDSALIQLGITDAQSIVWQKLDEASCSDNGDDCANKNFGCTWNDLANQNNYTVTESGEYRVVITYQNGCFSRFYFNVFKNTLDIQHTASDILCSTPGNIRVTNIGAGYGFQLVNTANNTIVVPFSSNNGPNFDISDNGSYKIQITQLDPISGNPIDGACIFETEEIGVLERDFQVDITTTPADCNTLGTISIQALNVLPQYSYELRLDDGSHGGQGTFVDDHLVSNDNTYTFTNVNPGNYIVTTTTVDGCTDTQNITVDEISELTLTAVTRENITCDPGIVNLTPGGGSPNPDYRMAVWSKDGTDLYPSPPNLSDIPPASVQTASAFIFNAPLEAGDYEFIVFDDKGCYAFSNVVTMYYLDSPSITASHSSIVCADDSTATLTVSVTGGTPPYQYSLDGGANYQTADTFPNLSAGFYTITVMDSSGSGPTGCVVSSDYEIDQPFRLTASAAIVEDASCNPSGALVKILNANGGQTPYDYSFDGGANFGSVNERNLPAGTYQLMVRDALGCTYDMDLTVPAPAIDPNLSYAVDYACDGRGTIIVSTSNTSDFEYIYSLNGTENTPSDNNVFANVAAGTQTVTVGYSSSIAPDQSTLFFEDFGAGTTTQIGEIGADYCYEPQDGLVTTCNRGPAGILVNGEYTVTNRVTNPVPFWTSPQDHTNLTDGRFLAIDVSNFSDTGNPQLNNILWARRDIEVLPNEEITLNFWAYNLMNLSGAGNNPEVLIEILDNTGALIHSEVAPEIPKNTNDTDWHERMITFDPGANTEIDIVFRTNVNSNDGNDLILDDITAFQVPSVCPKTQDLAVLVAADQAFDAQLLSVTNPSCNGASDGSIRFEVSNFDASAGFEYSLDGGANWIASMTTPVTTAATLADGMYTVLVRKADETSCSVNFPATIAEPSVIEPTLGLSAEFTCLSAGATLEASATGGSPGYVYQLEDTLGNIETPYQTSSIFPNITDGDYLVRVRDTNGCEVLLPSARAVTVSPPQTVAFTTSHTNCYDGQNNATITVQVTSGNGDYTFSINGGAPRNPSPTTPTEYTFTALANGTYTIEVFDNYGCSASNTATPVIIDQVLLAQVDAVDVTHCADGSITVTPSGGDGNYVYAFLPTGSTVADTDFGTSNTFTVNNATTGDYDVYVRDNNGSGTPDPYCQYIETVTVGNAPVLAFTTTPTDPECHDGMGSIDIMIAAGDGPFSIEIVDLDNGGASDQIVNNVLANNYTFFNLWPGDYTISVTDTYGCSMTDTPLTLNNPDALTASVIGVTPASCGGPSTDFGFDVIGYPTTIGTIEFSDDAGASWQSSDQFRGYNSGQIVYPSLRTVDGSGNTLCKTDLPQFIIPYPLDNLDITLSALVVNCNELQVVVQGSQGVAPYQYAFSDDPANFDPATATWFPGESTHKDGSAVPAGHGRYEWLGLVPGRTYVFYVQDNNGCTRQSDVNVNDLITQPLGISSSITPSCNSTNNGSITYTIVENIASPGTEMQWSFYDISSGTPILVGDSGGNVPFAAPQTLTFNSLGTGNYYIEVTKMDGAISSCVSASENELLEELDPITGTPGRLRDISCDRPGLIEIPDISGGGGTYYYDVTGPAPFTSIAGTLENPIEIPANSPSGSYTVTVADQYGCSMSLGSVNLNLLPDPDIHDIEVDNCGPQTNITVTSLSAAPIYYSIDNGAGYSESNDNGLFTNVPLGTFTATILDSNGCSDTDTVTVYPNLQANVVLTRNLGCGAGNEAEISVEAISGSGNYEYEIIGTSSTLISRQALAVNPTTVPIPTADTYTVHIYDIGVNGPECSRSFPIVVDPAIVPSISVDAFTTATCNGANNGTLTVTASNLVTGLHTLEIVSGTGAVLSTFPISAPNGGHTVTFHNLEATSSGINYTIRVTSPNGCIAETTQVISEPDSITVNTITPIEYGCSSGNAPENASLTFAGANGGSGNYVRYEFIRDGNPVQNGTNPTWIETDFAGGNYLINVYDEKGCVGSTNATIAPFDEMDTPTIHLNQNIGCTNTGEEIRIDVTGSITNSSTNLGNYQFTVLSSGTYTQDAIHQNVFTELQASTHTFAVRNLTTGCEMIIDHVVGEPNSFDLVVEKLSDVVCFGTDGSIRLTLVDATYGGGFSWRIFDTNGTPSDRSDDGPAIAQGNSANLGPTGVIPVPAGNYLAEVVQDAFPECSQVRSFSITTPPAPIALGSIDLTNVGCSNDQGSALIAPTGGEGPYIIALTHVGSGATVTATSVNSHLFQGLSAGDYAVSITDALTCNRVFNSAFNLVVPNPITGTISNTTLVCQGDADATVSVSLDPRNVTTNYRYVLNTYSDVTGSTLLSTSVSQNNPTFTNLGAGFYSISVTDDMDCMFFTPVVEIEDPTDVEAQLFANQAISCQMDAELVLVASGGTGPYEWSEDNGNFYPMNNAQGTGTHLFTSVASGNAYQYYIKDSFNCVSILSNEVSIDAIENLSVTLDISAANVNCNGEDTATIGAEASGGLGNYQYALFDADQNTEISANQPGGLFTSLPAGNYYIRVQSEDCETISQVIQVGQPEPLVVNPIISEISCADANDGSIVVEVTGGSGAYQFAISPNLNQFDEENTFDELAPGDYTVIVQDGNGCFELIEFSLTPPNALAVTYTVSDEICYLSNDGTLVVEITGGRAPYSTSLNSNEEADFALDVFDYSGLPSGNHILFIKDANGCEITEVFQVQGGVNLAGEAMVQYECDPQGTTSNSVQIVFEDPNISNEVLYGLDTDDPQKMQLEPVFENLTAGSHMITVVHSNGCSTNFPFEITIFDPLELQLSEGDINQISAEVRGGSGNYTFSFNNEPASTEQEYYIKETGTYAVTVSDENGCSITQEIFMEFIDIEIPNFFTPDGDGNNDSWAPRNIEQYPKIFIKIFDRYGRNIFQFEGNQDSWDGQYKFNGLPTGDYWYIIKLNGIEDEREFVGSFTLYR